MQKLIAEVIENGIAQCSRLNLSIYTFALYYDHESAAVSVCVDTRANSQKTVRQINRHSYQYFQKHVAACDLSAAGLWCANTGRSLSLGDFVLVNAGRQEVESDNPEIYLAMVKGLLAAQARIMALAESPEELLLCCSGPNDEVEYWWSPDPA